MDRLDVLELKLENLTKEVNLNSYVIKNLELVKPGRKGAQEMVLELMQRIGLKEYEQGLLKVDLKRLGKGANAKNIILISTNMLLAVKLEEKTFGKNSVLAKINEEKYGIERSKYIYVSRSMSTRERAVNTMLLKLKSRIEKKKVDEVDQTMKITGSNLAIYKNGKYERSMSLMDIYKEQSEIFNAVLEEVETNKSMKHEIRGLMSGWKTREEKLKNNVSTFSIGGDAKDEGGTDKRGRKHGRNEEENAIRDGLKVPRLE